MSQFQPPPTWAELLLTDPKSGKTAFNPIWLNWFISLSQGIAAGGPITSVTASAPLASSGGATPNITLGVIGPANFPALTGDITTAGGTLTTVLKNTGTAGTYTKVTFDANGRETSGTTAAASDLSNGVTGSGAIVLANAPTFTGSLLMSANGANDVGAASTGIKRLYVDYTNTATVGNVTINKASGTVNMAALASTMTVTNSLVTAASHVIVTLASDPGAAVAVWTIGAAGSFTINTRPAIVNQTAIDFLVVNAD
jgi:hypothetical protein